MLNQEENARLEEAHQFYEEGNFSDALIIYQDLAFSAPDDGFIFFDIAKTYVKLNNSKIAIANFDKAIKRLEPNHHYDVRKEFAAMCHHMGLQKKTANIYLPVANQPKSEEDLLTGIRYCLANEDIDTCEQLLVKHIQTYPNALEAATKITEVEDYLIERLKNRKRSVLASLKDDFRPTLDEAEKDIRFLKKDAEDGAFNALIGTFEKGMEAFDYAETVVEIVEAKAGLTAIASTIKKERDAFEKNLAQKEMSELKLENLSKLSRVNELELELNSFLKALPDSSLKEKDIPAYLRVVRDYKSRTTSTEILTVRRAYNDSDNLIKEGEFFVDEAKKSIEFHKEIAASQAVIISGNNELESTKTKRPKKEEKPKIKYIIGEKKRRRISPVFIWFPLLLLVVAGAYFIFMQSEKEKVILMTNVFLRQYPNGESAKVREDSYKDGEALVLLKQEGDWLNLKASDGNVGYMKAEYLTSPAEYTFIQGIFGNEEAREQFHSARHKLTLLTYFKENEWVGDISEALEKDIYGDSNPSREQRQIFALPEDSRSNTVVLSDFSPKDKMDLACLIRGQDDEKLIIYGYKDDNTPVKLFETSLDGTGHSFRALLDKTDNNYWFLGSYELGSKTTEKLNSNALLLSIDDECSFIYYYKNGAFDGFPQNGCE